MANPVEKKPVPAQYTPDPAFLAANALLEQSRLEEAAAAYQALLQKNPRDSGCWTNLGLTLRRQEKFEASAACYRRSLELNPRSASTLSNFGNTLVDLDRRDEALAAHKAAVDIDPNSLTFRKNYAIALREYHEFEESLRQFDIIIGLQPDDQKLKWERAMVYLHLGDFERGWPEYEVRWLQGTLKPRKFGVPLWAGESLEGKTILLHEEQGFGDTMLASRYIPLVAARGARIILETKKPLHRLFSTLPGIVAINEPNTTVAAFDYHTPMMSLPGIFETRLDDIPPPAKLFIPEVPPEAARLLALGKGRVKVGIIWSGSTTFARNRKRAVTADRFLPLAEIPGVQLYSLQKGPCEGELDVVGGKGLIPELAPHVQDFADTAAILKQLDLVIMTDSAVAHLAGSVGCPVWNLLCHYPYWLYLTEREDCLWYDSMRLVRQPAPGDWDGLFANVKADLEKIVRAKPR
ncbi:MAG: tetratricopeptide repeat-containing glycosyltransferase family protein [Micavibrio sp.]|nr:tetratricopeptide repeat-containing glycosyltransferase family protein [Micavibrio sp.]